MFSLQCEGAGGLCSVIIGKEGDKSPPSCMPHYLLTTCGLRQVNAAQAAEGVFSPQWRPAVWAAVGTGSSGGLSQLVSPERDPGN